MYRDMRVLSLIPARGGSKGIKNKNIIDLNGWPLLSYSIKESLGSKYVDMTVVSTDSDEIAETAKQFGAKVPFMRPGELASDNAKTVDVVVHAIKSLREMSCEFDVLVLLQPTQPLRTSEDIDEALDLFFESGMQGVASVSLVDDNPLLIRTIDDNCILHSLLNINSTCRRQDMPKYYRVNGCIYINNITDIDSTTSFNDNSIGYVMPRERSVDIDELKDLVVADYYMNLKMEVEK